ncbi:MAG: TMEM175 family protein [Acidimicrobiales bacterium]
MEAFSDGVFAIAITLLVLEIGVASGSEDDLLDAVLNQWPSYLAYLVSFSTIGAVWLEHTVITEYVERATSVLIRLNLLLLMVVAFLPFPTQLLGEYVGEDEPARVAVTIYGLNLFLVSALVSLLWRYAVRERLIRPGVADADVKLLTKRLTPGLAGYVAMIVLGLFLPVLAVLGYLAIAVYILCPSARSAAARPRRDRGPHDRHQVAQSQRAVDEHVEEALEGLG